MSKQQIIAATVNSENGKFRAEGRYRSVVAVRFPKDVLDALDDVNEAAGEYRWTRPGRSQLIVRAVREMLARNTQVLEDARNTLPRPRSRTRNTPRSRGARR